MIENLPKTLPSSLGYSINSKTEAKRKKHKLQEENKHKKGENQKEIRKGIQTEKREFQLQRQKDYRADTTTKKILKRVIERELNTQIVENSRVNLLFLLETNETKWESGDAQALYIGLQAPVQRQPGIRAVLELK